MEQIKKSRLLLFSLYFCIIIFYGCDTNPPHVEIVYPSESAVMEGLDVIIAEAHDEGQVVQVEFLIDGVSIGTDYKEPWEYVWNVSYWADDEPHIISAKAVDYSDNVGQSGLVTVFVPATAQVVPYLFQPSLTDIIQDTNTPLFQWYAIPNAISYEIEIGKFIGINEFEELTTLLFPAGTINECESDDDCSIDYGYGWICRETTCYNETELTNIIEDFEEFVNFDNNLLVTTTIDTFINIDIGLTDTTAGFFWHVRGENDAGNFSDWSNIWIFKITGPEGPGLHEPTTIDTIRTKPTFSWFNNQYLATEYQLILGGTDPNPNEEGIYNGLGYFEEIIFVDTIPRSNDILQQYLPNQDILIESGKHWWRINSKNDAGIWGEWSLTTHFFIEGPFEPILTVPSFGDIITNTNLPDFDWEDADFAVQYQLQIDKTGDFDSLDIDIIIPESIFELSNLSLDDSLNIGTSFWRVRAQNNVGLWGGWSPSSDFTISGPLHPELSYPTINKFITDRDELWFNWSHSENGILYQLQVDNESDFSSPEIDSMMVDTTFNIDFVINTGRNYWRVRSKNDIGLWGEWATEKSFRFYKYPDIPTLEYPSFDTTFTSQPVFSWVGDTTNVDSILHHYKLQISTTNSFEEATILVEEYPAHSGYSTEVYIAETEDEFFWRMLSRNEADTTYLESDWSEIRNFSGVATYSPSLINPGFGEILIDQPNFAWSTVVDGDNYQILVSNDSSFAEGSINIDRIIGGTGLTSDVSLAGGNNYWKVRTQNNLGIWSDYSDIGMFIVGGPLPLGLEAPVDSTTIYSQPNFSWNAMTDADKYQLVVDDSIDVYPDSIIFLNPEIDIEIVDISFTSIMQLAEGSNYWRVRGISALGIPGGWTQTWQFNLTGPMGPNLLSPIIGDPVYNTLTPYFIWDDDEDTEIFQIEISGNNEFNVIEYSDTTITTNSTTITDSLSEGTHYWRMRGQNELGMWGTWSNVENFEITGPPGPQLLYPDGQTITENATPVFSWLNQNATVQYRIQIAYDTDFTNIILDEFVDDTTYTPEEALVDVSVELLHWRVFSKNIFEFWGTSSDVNDFSLNGPNPPFNWTNTYYPSGEIIRDTNMPLFSWIEVDGGVKYQIQINDINAFPFPSDGFENPLVDAIVEEEIYQTDIELPQGDIYWNVRTQNIDGIWGNWYLLTTSFEITGTIPPVLDSPINESLSTQPTFTWHYDDSIPAIQYEIQVDNNPLNDQNEFPSMELNEVIDSSLTSHTSVDTLKGGENHWRMRSKNVVGYWGEWSELESFTMVGPNPPELVLPFDNDTVRYQPTFEWNPVLEAVDYQLEVNDNADFDSNSVEISIVQTELIYESIESLIGGDNFWRVRSRNIIGLWGEWSSPPNIFNLAGPISPVLISPILNDTLRTRPTFEWNESEYAINYEIQVDNSPDFSSPELMDEIETNMYASQDILLLEGINYWRIRGQNDAGIWGEWSNTEDFELLGPVEPILSSPGYGDPIIIGEWLDGGEFNYDINNLNLSWSASDEFSELYQLQISDSPDFTDSILELDIEIISLEQTIENILNGGNNYWRVRAQNNVAIWGDWSNIYYFWIPYSMPEDLELIEIPDDGSFIYGPPENEQEIVIPYYQISKYPVTNGQYLNYLNKAYEDTLINWTGYWVEGNCTSENIGLKQYYDLESPNFSDENIGKIYFNDELNIFELEDDEFLNHPAVFVSWCGAKAFALHHRLDLPTGIEWEKAARGVDGRLWHWGFSGEGDLDTVNHYTNRLNSYDPWDCVGCSGGTTPVGFYNGINNLNEGFPYYGSTVYNSPSPYGIYDMCGNIGEWTDDLGSDNGIYDYRSGSGFSSSSTEEIKVFALAELNCYKTTKSIGFRVVQRE